jgi:hypothetical protein
LRNWIRGWTEETQRNQKQHKKQAPVEEQPRKKLAGGRGGDSKNKTKKNQENTEFRKNRFFVATGI